MPGSRMFAKECGAVGTGDLMILLKTRVEGTAGWPFTEDRPSFVDLLDVNAAPESQKERRRQQPRPVFLLELVGL